jgi:opacity protein-like surface antigen
MKSLVLRSIAVIAICVSIPAHAADMAIKAPPPTVPVAPYNWSGLYVGGNFGGAWTSGNLNIPGNNFYGGLTEFIGGVQAGYNFQTGNFLYGVEGDLDWATFDHPTLPTPTLGSVSQHWIGTAAARVGVVQDRWLVYGKLGGGWVHSSAEVNAFGLGTGPVPKTAGLSARGSNTVLSPVGGLTSSMSSSGWRVGIRQRFPPWR